MGNLASQSIGSRGVIGLAGAALILVPGLIHLIFSAQHFDPAYLGVLFLAESAGALVTAVGLVLGYRSAWVLGLMVAGGPFVAFFVVKLIGLPGIPPEGVAGLLNPGAIVARIAEVLFVVLALVALVSRGRAAS